MSEVPKVESGIKNTAGTICTPLRTNKYRGVTYSVDGASERSFKKIKFLEFEEEEENNSPTDFDDDGFDNTDLFCDEDDEEDYVLCSGCDENLFAHLGQLCSHMISTNCVIKNN